MRLLPFEQQLYNLQRTLRQRVNEGLAVTLHENAIVQRGMNLEEIELVGRGRTSDVYAWGENRVLKLYKTWMPGYILEREFAVTRTIHAAGGPAPATHEIIEVAGRRGIVFDRVRGMSLLRLVEASPWRIFAAARQLAELHAHVHAIPAPPGLPSQRRQIEDRINEAGDFSEPEKQAARSCLAQLPEGAALCHGDFHPDNILLTARGPVIIDWVNGAYGHPLCDVARTSQLFEIAKLPEDAAWHIRILFKFSRAALHTTYLDHYLRLRPGTRAEIDAWRPPLKSDPSAWRSLLAKRKFSRSAPVS